MIVIAESTFDHDGVRFTVSVYLEAGILKSGVSFLAGDNECIVTDSYLLNRTDLADKVTKVLRSFFSLKVATQEQNETCQPKPKKVTRRKSSK
jgi:hypothetical protein